MPIELAEDVTIVEQLTDPDGKAQHIPVSII